MKILFIAPLPPPITGQSIAVHALFEQLILDGHTVMTINLSKNTFRQGISSLSRIIEVLYLAWKVLRVHRRFDVIYLTTSESLAGNLKDILLLAILGSRRQQTWLHLHGGAGMRNLLKNRSGYIGRLNGFFLCRVAGVIVLGERLASIFEGYVKPEQIHIVKNFAADNLFLDPSDIFRKWSDSSILRVLYLSNLLPGKGYEELLQVIQNLPSSMAKRFSFDFAGGFESVDDKLRFQAAIARLPGVKYHGVVDGEMKRKLLANAHIFCLPTFYKYEGQPISILEAYASGCVVVTTNHSGIFDIFTPGKNGLEVRQRSPSSIFEALETLSTNYIFARELAYHNRQQADALYTRRSHLIALYAALGWGQPT